MRYNWDNIDGIRVFRKRFQLYQYLYFKVC